MKEDKTPEQLFNEIADRLERPVQFLALFADDIDPKNVGRCIGGKQMFTKRGPCERR